MAFSAGFSEDGAGGCFFVVVALGVSACWAKEIAQNEKAKLIRTAANVRESLFIVRSREWFIATRSAGLCEWEELYTVTEVSPGTVPTMEETEVYAQTLSALAALAVAEFGVFGFR
jgi:hypothetical protein